MWKTDAVRGWLLVTDRLRLEQVLINIIGNAVSLQEREGMWYFPLHRRKRCSGGQRLTFSVKDTGIGIASEALTAFSMLLSRRRKTLVRYGEPGWACYFQPPGPDDGGTLESEVFWERDRSSISP